MYNGTQRFVSINNGRFTDHNLQTMHEGTDRVICLQKDHERSEWFVKLKEWIPTSVSTRPRACSRCYTVVSNRGRVS